jgi:hypothetical protein
VTRSLVSLHRVLGTTHHLSTLQRWVLVPRRRRSLQGTLHGSRLRRCTGGSQTCVVRTSRGTPSTALSMTTTMTTTTTTTTMTRP